MRLKFVSYPVLRMSSNTLQIPAITFQIILVHSSFGILVRMISFLCPTCNRKKITFTDLDPLISSMILDRHVLPTLPEPKLLTLLRLSSVLILEKYDRWQKYSLLIQSANLSFRSAVMATYWHSSSFSISVFQFW